MKKLALVALIASSASVMAFGDQTPTAVAVQPLIKCRIIETLRGLANQKYKQQSYNVQSVVADTDTGSQIVVSSRFVGDFTIDFFGCPSCATTGTVRHPEINAVLTETVTGAKAFSTFESFGTGMLTVGDKTVAYICNLIK